MGAQKDCLCISHVIWRISYIQNKVRYYRAICMWVLTARLLKTPQMWGRDQMLNQQRRGKESAM